MRIYLDTSVFSAFYDERTPERLQMTHTFWQVLDRYERVYSALTIEELNQARPEQRAKLLDLTKPFTALEITEEMRALADGYVGGGVVPPKYFVDALHIAAAVLGNADILVSWNFEHLVRRRTRLMVNSVNAKMGLRTIEILAPPEV